MARLGDPLVILVARDDVERRDVGPTASVLAKLLGSAEIAASYRERVDIAFMGYDDDPSELFQILKVRDFVAELDAKFPYWLYFLSRNSLGLQAIVFCFLPPFLTAEAQRTIWPEKLGEWVEKRWGPALVALSAQTGINDAETERMLISAMHYFLEGPRLPFDPSAA